MAIRPGGVFRHLDRLWRLGAVGGLTDAQLLARFTARHEDGAELAFEALVERHGPMVFRVCRGVLRDEHAAEDAFQATFLVLARKARSLWVKDSLGSWLHGVAHRVASRVKADEARRRGHERRLAEARGAAWEVVPDCPYSDASLILSEEIARLPEKYRAPIVLCYLEAMSYETAACRLGVTEDAVRGRLARARDRLRARLTRRGVEMPGILAAFRPMTPAVAVRPGIVQATARAAMSLSTGGAASSGMISRSVVSLSERTCRTMMLNKLRAAAAALVLGFLTVGVGVFAQPSAGGGGEPSGSAPQAKRPPRSVPGNGGNLIVDWIPVDGKGGKKVITVDPTRHCVHLAVMSMKRDDRPNDGAVRLDLEHGKTYTVTASGEAFMTEQTGADADPYPGVVLLYGTDEEDCYADRQIVLAPGKSITFRAPWNINPRDEVWLMAFFLDRFPGDPKRGSYTLTVTESGEEADLRLKQLQDASRRLDRNTQKKTADESDAKPAKRRHVDVLKLDKNPDESP
jgi:RNA polymerase sigma factor (sigma-70 family)